MSGPQKEFSARVSLLVCFAKPERGEQALVIGLNLEQQFESLQAERDALAAACKAAVAKYQDLLDGMDTEYAAFFTAMGGEVRAIASLIGSPAPEKAR